MNEITEKKKQNRSRNVALTFRVTPEEKEMVERRMAQAKIENMRAFLLKMAIDGRVIHVELDSVREMNRLLSNVSNNINQVTKRVNQTGNIYTADLDDIKKGVDVLWEQQRKILSTLSVIK